jgi:hypothetical protein
MSRPFMLGVLVILGVLLYLTSFALNKQTEPPKPPSAEEQAKIQKASAAEKENQMKEMQDRYRKQAQEKAAAAKKASGDSDAKLGQGPSNANSMLPNPTTRSDKSIDIRNTWFADRKDGAAGIEAERALREKNNKLEAKQPKAPVQSGEHGMQVPSMPSSAGHGAGDGHGH